MNCDGRRWSACLGPATAARAGAIGKRRLRIQGDLVRTGGQAMTCQSWPIGHNVAHKTTTRISNRSMRWSITLCPYACLLIWSNELTPSFVPVSRTRTIENELVVTTMQRSRTLLYLHHSQPNQVRQGRNGREATTVGTACPKANSRYIL